VVIVSAEVAGHVEAVPAVEGRPCKPGDLIVRLNRELFEAEHERAKAQLAFSQAELGRVEQLAGRQVLTEKELDAARNQVVAAQSALRMARYNLERADIAAPIAGVLNKVTVEKGEYLQAGRAVAEIVEVDTVKVVAQLPERDVRFIKVGDAADVTDDAGDGRSRRQGQATYISELADSQTRTTRTEITLDNRDRKLKSGQIVQVEMARQRLRGVIMIPLAAVIPLEESYAVYVAEGDKAQRRDVKLGFLKGREVQVTDGLKPGDRLIVAGHRLVGPGQDIRIVEAVGSNASAKAAP
jgi:membrane fusion protein (multidrug efflux system)